MQDYLILFRKCQNHQVKCSTVVLYIYIIDHPWVFKLFGSNMLILGKHDPKVSHVYVTTNNIPTDLLASCQGQTINCNPIWEICEKNFI